jgi:UDP-3-O-[3-hydroxymyristoyl] glucosamine N-acyltransferase
MGMQRTLKQLAEWLGVEFSGDPGLTLTGVGPLETADEHTLSFLANPKYKDQLGTTRAGAVVLAPDVPTNRAVLRSRNPYADFTKVVALFAPPIPVPPPGVHPLAWVHPEAKLGRETAVGPFCVVGAGAVLGDRTVLVAQVFVGEQTHIGDDGLLYPGVVVRERVRVGHRVVIHGGAVIGADGFGFAPVGEGYAKIPQIGTVVIEDDVEIGANTTVDRATLGETRLGQGCKLDNLVQIAHNVVVGPHTVIAAQAGISGSTQVGRHAMIGGQAGTVGHIRIGDQAVLGAQAGATRDVPAQAFFSGYPARAHADSMRQLGALTRLPDLLKKVQALEARLKALEGK